MKKVEWGVELISSATQSYPNLCDPMDWGSLGFPVHHQLPELAQTHLHQVSNAIQPSHPLPSPSPPASIFPSIGVFSNESVLCIRWPTYWSFSFSITPFNEYSGVISFRTDWFELLAVQETLKSLQHQEDREMHFKDISPCISGSYFLWAAKALLTG